MQGTPPLSPVTTTPPKSKALPIIGFVISGLHLLSLPLLLFVIFTPLLFQDKPDTALSLWVIPWMFFFGLVVPAVYAVILWLSIMVFRETPARPRPKYRVALIVMLCIEGGAVVISMLASMISSALVWL